jgi:hypothetical protein
MDNNELNNIIDAKLEKFKADFLAFRSKQSFGGVVDQYSPITGASQQIGFFGTNKISKPTVTGSRGSNAALTSLLTALSALGLIKDSTS